MENEGIKSAGSNEILSEAKAMKGMRQADLAVKLGMAQPSLSGNMNRTRIGLDVFAKILDAIGYDVVIIDREDGKSRWKVKV